MLEELLKEKEELLKDIENITEQIELERSFNPDKGTVSFLQWQRYMSQEKLNKVKEEICRLQNYQD